MELFEVKKKLLGTFFLLKALDVNDREIFLAKLDNINRSYW